MIVKNIPIDFSVIEAQFEIVTFVIEVGVDQNRVVVWGEFVNDFNFRIWIEDYYYC